MSAPALRLGTRASALALTQSGHVATALRGLGREVDLVRVQTAGDLSRDAITQLGGTARGTVQEVNRETSLEPYRTDIYAVADHMKALIDRYAKFANAVRENIDDTDEAGDAGTADLLTEVSRAVDKQLWFLEAHAQEPSGTFRT